MKIFVISQYYYPEPFRVYEVCEELVRKGHEVTVLTGLPNYPEGKVYKGYENFAAPFEMIKGVKVYRCQNRPRKSGVINLSLNYLSFVKATKKKLKKMSVDCDVIYVYQLSPVLMALPAIALKKWMHKPLYLYCLDLWPASIDDYIGNKSFLYKIIANKSRQIYSNADRIGVTSPAFKDYLRRLCGKKTPEIKYFPQHAEDLTIRHEINIEDNGIVDFMFAGNIGSSQNMGIILKAADMLKSHGLTFRIHIVGSGSELENLKKQADAMQLGECVIFHGRHPSSEMWKFYSLADVCLLTLTGNGAVSLTIPGKLQSYMSAGRMIIASIDGAAKDIIEDANCGICVPAGDTEGLYKAMAQYIESSEKYVGCGKNARRYFEEHFTLEQHVRELEKQLEKIVWASKKKRKS